jgi:hypothetical protein
MLAPDSLFARVFQRDISTQAIEQLNYRNTISYVGVATGTTDLFVVPLDRVLILSHMVLRIQQPLLFVDVICSLRSSWWRDAAGQQFAINSTETAIQPTTTGTSRATNLFSGQLWIRPGATLRSVFSTFPSIATDYTVDVAIDGITIPRGNITFTGS